MTEFLEFVRGEKPEVMRWSISESYKNLYEMLCESEEQFMDKWAG